MDEQSQAIRARSLNLVDLAGRARPAYTRIFEGIAEWVESLGEDMSLKELGLLEQAAELIQKTARITTALEFQLPRNCARSFCARKTGHCNASRLNVS
jgi:hypothetical protein